MMSVQKMRETYCYPPLYINPVFSGLGETIIIIIIIIFIIIVIITLIKYLTLFKS